MDDSINRPGGLQVATGQGFEWSEVRLQGNLPERRTNHCSFIVNDYLYIHGGRDIKVGSMNNMWRLSLDGIHELMEDPEHGVEWESVVQKGTVPSNISHHKPAVFGHQVVVFGGIVDSDDNPNAYEFDSNKNTWTKLQQTGDVPKPRDDHSLAQIDDKSFLIFGGFVQGSRVNECYSCKKNGNTLEWKRIGDQSADKPCVRASQSAVVYNGKCYIFGGMSDDNIKLNDLWELDLGSEQFKEIQLGDGSFCPSARSGHSANIFNDKMVIFGGILELTKELNEMLMFDFKTKCFIVHGESHNEDLAALQTSHKRAGEEDTSPLARKGTLKKSAVGQATMGSSASPTKLGGTSYGSPTKLQKSPTLRKGSKRAGKSPSKAQPGEKTEKKESGLASPTSISMQNSFIIKNADESFDAYFQIMKKRKMGGAAGVSMMDGTMATGGASATLAGGSPTGQESNFGVVRGIQPAARDGHSTEISSDGLMFVFGGDRHLMPFNDLYLMNLN